MAAITPLTGANGMAYARSMDGPPVIVNFGPIAGHTSIPAFMVLTMSLSSCNVSPTGDVMRKEDRAGKFSLRFFRVAHPHGC